MLKMEIDQLTAEAIALTDKKMNMTLDDIIKMSKSSSGRKKAQRVPIKSQGSRIKGVSNGNPKIQNFMDSRSSLRQSVLAFRRSNSRENQFPIVSEAVKEAVRGPVRRTFYSRSNQRQRGISFITKASGSVNGKHKFIKQRDLTLDDRFASMKWKRILKDQAISGLQTAKRRPVQERLGGLVLQRGLQERLGGLVLQRGRQPHRRQWSGVASLQAAQRPVGRGLGGSGLLKSGQRSYIGQRLVRMRTSNRGFRGYRK